MATSCERSRELGRGGVRSEDYGSLGLKGRLVSQLQTEVQVQPGHSYVLPAESTCSEFLMGSWVLELKRDSSGKADEIEISHKRQKMGC